MGDCSSVGLLTLSTEALLSTRSSSVILSVSVSQLAETLAIRCDFSFVSCEELVVE